MALRVSLAYIHVNRMSPISRVIARLVQGRKLKATEPGVRRSSSKMRAGRAVTGLESDGLIVRATAPCDRRNSLARLTASGCAAYRKIEPIALEREAVMLAALSEDERTARALALGKVEQRALQVQEAD